MLVPIGYCQRPTFDVYLKPEVQPVTLILHTYDQSEQGRLCQRKAMMMSKHLKNRGTARFQEKEEGQSLLEMSVGLIFLLGIVLIIFESALLFQAYIVLHNAAREGAVYAAYYPTMTAGSAQYTEYENRTRNEATAAGLLTDAAHFVIDAPVAEEGTADGKPITVRVHYQFINPMQGIILPFFGRMGLFDSVWMSAFMIMPIRAQ